ncbi:MAG: cyclic nucleotide-binding domain-containing protein, partial [Limisphaerales bacterium]
LPDTLLAEAAALFTTRTLEAGRELFREGDHADAFYVIVRGRVEAFKGIGTTHKRIGVMEVGDALGEIALLQDSPRTATVRAITPATLLSLSREHFQNLFAVSRELRLALNEMVESRLKADRLSESAQNFVVPTAAAVVATPAPSGQATPEQLSGVPILHQLPEELRREAADLFTSEDLTTGQLVFREGQPADAFYVIVSGRVAVTKRFPDGQRELACLHAGDAFGEIALLSDSPRTATLRAVEPTTLLRLGREEFNQMLSRAPALQQQLRTLAAGRVAANLAAR